MRVGAGQLTHMVASRCHDPNNAGGTDWDEQ